ncbi:MAG: D-alanyl-D-alanine carboxypeptidase family protein [Anaerorhabdus sp.]
MKIKRLIFVLCVLGIVTLCMAYMNSKYDPLARYPYQGEEMRETIRENLTRKEMEYIIEYSINPDLFIDYIEVNRFNIYHATEYKYISNFLWTDGYEYPDPSDVVSIVESTWGQISKEELGVYLSHYGFEDMEEWFDKKEIYNSESTLIKSPNRIETYMNSDLSVFRYEPKNLVSLDDLVPTNSSDEIKVTADVLKSWEQLCVDIESELSIKNCAGLVIEEGFVSYEEQVVQYQNAVAEYGDEALKFVDYPGHSENQLGLAIDFTIRGVKDAEQTDAIQYQWLMEKAHLYGFIQSYTLKDSTFINRVPALNHLRYVGVDLATYLFNETLSFSEYNAK